MSFCSLTKGITPKIGWFCLVLINSVLLNLLCVWILLVSSFVPGLQRTSRQPHRVTSGRERVAAQWDQWTTGHVQHSSTGTQWDLRCTIGPVHKETTDTQLVSCTCSGLEYKGRPHVNHPASVTGAEKSIGRLRFVTDCIKYRAFALSWARDCIHVD